VSENEDSALSLRVHLINWLLTPLFILWLFSTIAGYVATLTYANKPYDMVLLQRAQAVGAQLGLNGGKERLTFDLDLPDGTALAMPDKVFYTVSDQNGKKLAGNANLSRPISYRGGKITPIFSNSERDGEKTRNVSLVFYNVDTDKLYQLHMSETIHQRQALIQGILANIVIPQLLLILVAVAAVWFALKQGLAPLERLRRDVVNRKRDDLHQLDSSQAPEEVRPLIDAVNNLLERLRLVMQAQQRFVADAAHQLRTPLAGLKTQAELALREDDSERKQHALKLILTSARHGTRLVNQLLVLARNEPGAQSLETFTLLDLNQLAQECTVNWVQTALEKNIDIGFEGGGAPVNIKGDTNSLTEMLNNLIDNAVRYTASGGHITVGVTTQKKNIELFVEDNGPGIELQHRERVFERFYRVLGSGQSGSGIGLAIVAEVAKRHGAEISLNSGDNGIGTRFSMQFPVP
jgi:two-component system sensor histidine kinase TctE